MNVKVRRLPYNRYFYGLFAYLAIVGYLKRTSQDDPSNDGYYEFLENIGN